MEQFNVSTFMEQNKLVVNIIESKTTEYKPWAPTLSQTKYGMIQLIKGFKIINEIYPAFSEIDMNKIDY